MPLKRPNCPNCGNRAEFYKTQIYCKRCEGYFKHSNAPKVLILDIEVSRVRVAADVWASDIKYREAKINYKNITGDWFMICWRARWLFKKEQLGAVVTPKEAKKRDDKRVTQELFDVLKTADFVITYNGDKFDLKKITWLLIKHKIKPVPHYGSIDIMRGIKEIADPTSSALGFISKELGYAGKLDTDKSLWEEAEAGDEEALACMYKYNATDVDETESVYLHVLPYLKRHPNFAEFLNYYQEVDKTLDVGKNNHRCPRCLQGIVSDEKFTRYRQTPSGYFYRRANCPNCGSLVFKVHKDNQFSKHSQKVFVR